MKSINKWTFQPKLNNQTMRMAQIRKVPIFQRLYEPSKEKVWEKYVTCSPTATVNRDDKKITKKTKPIKSMSQKQTQSKIEFKMEVDEEKVTSYGVNIDEYESGVIPQLFIDVHLDDQSIHRLTIYEGDDPNKLARDFCDKYGKIGFSIV